MNPITCLAIAALVLPLAVGVASAEEDNGRCVTTTLVETSGLGLFWRADDTIVLGARTGAAGQGKLILIEIAPTVCGPTGDVIGDITALPQETSSAPPPLQVPLLP